MGEKIIRSVCQRTFARLREMIATHEDLRLKLEVLERRYDEQFKLIFDAFRKLLEDEGAKPQIGFKETQYAYHGN